MDALINLFGGMFIGLSLSIFLFVLFPVGLAYVALRVRDSRAAVPDPKLGLKLAYHVIQSLAVLMVLIGLSISAADLMQGILGGNQRNAAPAPVGRGQRAPAPAADEFWNVPQRSAAALVGTGALFTLVFWMLLTGTNDRKYPAVRRSFLGGRLAICLLLVFVSITAIAVIAVQKDPKLEPVEMLIGVLIVWLPASAIHVFALRRAMGLPLEPVPAILE